VLKSWEFDPWTLIFVLLTGIIYVSGWRKLRRQMPHRLGPSRLVSFLSGLAVIIIAIASPLDAFASMLLLAHMIQHLLLLMVAPPLILYGAPYPPILRGLPSRVLKHGAGPFLASPGLQKFGRWLTHPLVCWLTFTITSLTWQVPKFYELALGSPFWHEAEHLCFLGAALLFWWPVIQPWPSRAQWPRWAMIPYLFLADFQNTALAAFLIFCERVVYFVQSLVSPLEVQVRDPDICRTCTTYDCIRGNDAQRGCELALFQPKKSGNLDCTFCLDCIHACPHQNVGIIAITPGSQLTHNRYRSALGRLSQRTDIAVLVLLLVFGAFVNAAGMIGPVAEMERNWQQRLGLESLLPVTSALFVLALLIAPFLLVMLCGVACRALSGSALRWRELICSFALALAPLGFSMWVAHLGYHFLTGATAVIPVTQRLASDLGISLLGRPNWAGAALLLPIDWLLSLQIFLLDGGLLLTLYVGWRVARAFSPRARGALSLLAPWAGLAVLLYAAGVWIVFQPMEMRGTMPGMQACPMSSRMPGMQH